MLVFYTHADVHVSIGREAFVREIMLMFLFAGFFGEMLLYLSVSSFLCFPLCQPIRLFRRRFIQLVGDQCCDETQVTHGESFLLSSSMGTMSKQGPPKPTGSSGAVLYLTSDLSREE